MHTSLKEKGNLHLFVLYAASDKEMKTSPELRFYLTVGLVSPLKRAKIMIIAIALLLALAICTGMSGYHYGFDQGSRQITAATSGAGYKDEITVYVSGTGECYHKEDCHHIAGRPGVTPMSLKKAEDRGTVGVKIAEVINKKGAAFL